MPGQLKMSLKKFGINAGQIRQEFKSIINGKPVFKDLQIIFDIAINDMTLFPDIRLPGEATYLDYLAKYRYYFWRVKYRGCCIKDWIYKILFSMTSDFINSLYLTFLIRQPPVF